MPDKQQLDTLRVCLNGNLYDLTEFSVRHPGGPLTAYNKQDVTEIFTMYHDPNFIQRLRPYHMGPCIQQHAPHK